MKRNFLTEVEIARDGPFVLVERDMAYFVADLETGLDHPLRWAEIFGSAPMGAKGLDAGSYLVDLARRPDSEELYAYWFYPFEATTHRWVLNREGERLRGEWLQEAEVDRLVADKPRRRPEFLFRELMLAQQRGVLTDDHAGIGRVTRELVSESVELAYFVARNTALFTAELYEHAVRCLQKFRVDMADSVALIRNDNAFRKRMSFVNAVLDQPGAPRIESGGVAALAPLRLQHLMRDPSKTLGFAAFMADARLSHPEGADVSDLAQASLGVTFRFDLALGRKPPLELTYFPDKAAPSNRLYEGMNYLHYVTRTFLLNPPELADIMDEIGGPVPERIEGSMQTGDGSVDLRHSLAYQSRADFGLTQMIPDPYFFNTFGYLDFRNAMRASRIAWDDKKDIAFWRGTTTGSTTRWSKVAVSSLEQVPRYILCRKGLEFGSRADFGFSGVVQAESEKDKTELEQYLRSLGLLVPYVPSEMMESYKYLVDIDGNANSWGLFNKLLTGSCVLKVATSRKHSQWYYGQLQEWKHYVPVAPDMSDLEEKLDWCFSHPLESQLIGEGGRRLAKGLKFRTEMRNVAKQILKLPST